MSAELDILLERALKNERIAKKVAELQLNEKQKKQALPIFVSMLQEEGNDELTMLTSFYIADSGSVMVTFVPSAKGIALEYLNNIVTQDIYHLDFDESPFEKTSERKLVVNAFVKYTQDDSHNKGLYIYGEMGIGKTFILKKFAKKLAEGGKQVGYINVPELVSAIKQTFGNPTKEKYNNIITKLQDVDYLFMDDIGAETIAGWFRDDVLFTILNHRMDKKKPVFFTSNYSQQKLTIIEQRTYGSKYPDKDKALRLMDRIKATSIEVPLLGKNRRY